MIGWCKSISSFQQQPKRHKVLSLQNVVAACNLVRSTCTKLHHGWQNYCIFWCAQAEQGIAVSVALKRSNHLAAISGLLGQKTSCLQSFQAMRRWLHRAQFDFCDCSCIIPCICLCICLCSCMFASHETMMRVSASQCCDCSRVFPNEEMDQLATALRQVARMLWGIHVTLQMGFEQEASPTQHALSCIPVHVRGHCCCNPFACSILSLFLLLSVL